MTDAADGTENLAAVLAQLDAMTAAVDEFLGAKLFALNGLERLTVSRQLEIAARKVGFAQVAMAAEHELAADAKSHGAASTAALLAHTLNISRAEAGRRVALAAQTCDTIAISGDLMGPQMPAMGAAMAAGTISTDHARIIAAAVHDKTVTHLDRAILGEAEEVLVDCATQMEPVTLSKAAQKIVETLNPDGLLDDERYDPAAHAELHLGPRDRRTGLTPLAGKLDDLGAETLRRAIDTLSAPRPEQNGVKDPRPAPTRRAHALVEALRALLDTGSAPVRNSVRPHITATMTLDELLDLARGAHLLDGTHLSAAHTRMLLCDADIVPVVLGGRGEVLDVGRALRTATPAIRRAVTARDKGCAFPGCDRPPEWCDFHHLIWWSRGGPTSVEQGCLLCPHHHTEIHREHWKARRGNDGLPEFIPPLWVDPEQKPRRNIMHDPPIPRIDTGCTGDRR